MVAAHYRGEDEAVTNTLKQTVRYNKVVDTPPYVLCACGEHIAPPGILDLVGIKRAEGVLETAFKKFCEFAALLVGKACTLTVRLRIFKIYFVVRDV